jgi:hypothetical protein
LLDKGRKGISGTSEVSAGGAEEDHSRVGRRIQLIERSLKLFNLSTTAYARYRKFQCEHEASSAAGGNGAGDMRLSCQVLLDAAYLKSNQEKIDGFTGRGH